MIKCTTREEDWKLIRTDTTLDQTGEKRMKTGKNNKGLKTVSVSAKIHANFDLISWDLAGVTQIWLFLLILQGIAGTTGVANFLPTFMMVSLNSLFSGTRNKFLVIFLHYRVHVFQATTFASPSAWHFFPISSRVLAINNLAWMLTVLLSVSPKTTHLRLEVFLPIE